MSDADPDSRGENELKRALMAAFGDDAMSILDDEFDDEYSDEALMAMKQSQEVPLPPPITTVTPNPIPPSLEITEADSVRAQWMKQLCSAIYFPTIDSQTSASTQFVVFSVGENRFGIPLDAVCEIGRCPQVTQLPCTPGWLRGVANFRGEVHSVTDFRNLVGITGQRPVVGEMVVVIRSPKTHATTALAVDQVIGIKKLESDESNPPKFEQFSKIGCGVSQDDDSTVFLVDPNRVFAMADLKTPTPA